MLSLGFGLLSAGLVLGFREGVATAMAHGRLLRVRRMAY